MLTRSLVTRRYVDNTFSIAWNSRKSFASRAICIRECIRDIRHPPGKTFPGWMSEERRGGESGVKKTRVQKGSRNGSAVNGNAFYIVTSGREEEFRGNAGINSYTWVHQRAMRGRGMLGGKFTRDGRSIDCVLYSFFFFLADSFSTSSPLWSTAR